MGFDVGDGCVVSAAAQSIEITEGRPLWTLETETRKKWRFSTRERLLPRFADMPTCGSMSGDARRSMASGGTIKRGGSKPYRMHGCGCQSVKVRSGWRAVTTEESTPFEMFEPGVLFTWGPGATNQIGLCLAYERLGGRRVRGVLRRRGR